MIRRFKFDEDFTPRKFAFADDGGDETSTGGDDEIVLDGETKSADAEDKSTDGDKDDKSSNDDKDDKSSNDDKDKEGAGDDAIKKTTEDEAEEDAAKSGPPETYEFKGLDDADLKAEDVKEFAEWAKGKGLTQEQAQSILTDELENAKDGTDKATEDFEKTTAGWRKAARGDKHEDFPIGGDHFDEAVGNANRAIKAYGTPELVAALNETGMNNHPEIIRLLSRAGKEVAEDTLVDGGSKLSSRTRTNAELFYPDTK